MLKDITIGQYLPGNSPIHKMDARVKIILSLIYIASLFIIKKPVSYAVFAVYTVTLVMISDIPLKYILKGLKPMLWVFILTTVLNLFMTPGESLVSIPLYKFSLRITREGINISVLLILRLVFLIVGSSILTLTTSPLRLTDGIEKLLNPLKRIKVPAHEIAMMMTIAIRFIPTLSEEADKVMKAQEARGADFETGNIIHRAKAMTPVLVPLFVSAFRRADELATAMEARCYNGGEKRTKMKESQVTAIDIKACLVFAVCMVILAAAELIIEI